MGRLLTDEVQRVAAWVASRTGQDTTWGECYALGIERDGEIVSGVVFNNFNGVSASAHIAVDKPGKDMLLLIRSACDYAFRHAGLKRLTGMVPASSPKVMEFDLKIGFQYECTMKEAAYDGSDLNVLVMWARTCPWLPKD
jgi:RimJ/RimL family protein N-acetyltransferase